ncbi:MAG: hypothetical protein A4E23_01500 [Methanomethylovorans sp. PtaU1.Bin073]|nr:MAG: hypothetical protein A4E23_01500 [Methanomethylovorans sp. PtaU1.Bin073]
MSTPSDRAKPPLDPISLLITRAISTSSVPMAMMLWESWATVEAIAPLLISKPFMNPMEGTGSSV